MLSPMKEAAEKKTFMIAKIFDEISKTYDIINTLLSFGLDKRWRKKALAFIPKDTNEDVLDIACGSCAQILALGKARSNCRFTGIDISEKLLTIGRKKLSKTNYKVEGLITGSALDLPFEAESFSICTLSFGIRNMENVDKALKEAYRVLKKDGKILVLEFSLPKRILFKKFALFYLKHILPKIGNLLSNHLYAYTYLNETIRTFPSGEAFVDLLKRAGFIHTDCHPMTFGMVTLYVGEKL
jgi:demethylmenaquinone methyltransferase/2-methoxy-6-polyprenyl-1,4-benzoquinol methylase